MIRQEWVLKRNCSITPRQLVFAYSGLCLASLLVAMYFTMHGAWYVLVFSVLELSVVGGAFLLYALHATDRERIALCEECLLVEQIEMEWVRRVQFDVRRIRVTPPTGSALVGLEGDGIRIEVGRFLPERKRRELAQELDRALTFKEQTEF